MNNKIAVYGGAFDPPQLAHEIIANEAIRMLGLDKLYIVPSGSHGFKSFKTTDKYRRKISEIFIKSIDSEKAELDTVFLDGKLINTTLNTDKYFTEKLGIRPYQIFGSDLIEEFWKWDPTGEVAMRIPKILVKRPGYDIDYSRVANFEVFDPFHDSYVAMLSSTLVRENIKKNIFYGLNPLLQDFIHDNSLYL